MSPNISMDDIFINLQLNGSAYIYGFDFDLENLTQTYPISPMRLEEGSFTIRDNRIIVF